jgi:hypothetical protein
MGVQYPLTGAVAVVADLAGLVGILPAVLTGEHLGAVGERAYLGSSNGTGYLGRAGAGTHLGAVTTPPPIGPD